MPEQPRRRGRAPFGFEPLGYQLGASGRSRHDDGRQQQPDNPAPQREPGLVAIMGVFYPMRSQTEGRVGSFEPMKSSGGEDSNSRAGRDDR